MGQNQTNPFKENDEPIIQDGINQHKLHQHQQNKLQYIKRISKKHINSHKNLDNQDRNVNKKQQALRNRSLFYGNKEQQIPDVKDVKNDKNVSRTHLINLSPSKHKISVEKKIYINSTLNTNSKSPSKTINPINHQNSTYTNSNQQIFPHQHLFSTQYIQQQPVKIQQFQDNKYQIPPFQQPNYQNSNLFTTTISRQLPQQQIKVNDGPKNILFKQNQPANIIPQNAITHQPAYTREQFSSINIDHQVNKSKEMNVQNYFPSHINQFIQPTHSIHYEVNKATYFNDAPKGYQTINQDLTIPLNLKAQQTESQIVSKPQYVEQQFKEGSKYIGYKLNGQRHGKGTFYYQDGGSYDGEWNNNKMEGKGTLYYQSGKIAYEGNWIDDKFHGKGKLYNQFALLLQQNFNYENFDDIDEYWQFYEGDFMEDLKNGKGRLRFSNGQIFDGTFKQDMVEGEGYFYARNGEVIHGFWKQNYLQKIIN